MKVKIKPYATYFGPHQLVYFLFYLFSKPDEFVICRNYPEWVHRILYFYAESRLGEFHARIAQKYVDWKDSRRVSVKVDNYDTWCASSTFASVIIPVLKELKNTKHGAPAVDDEDVPQSLRSTEDLEFKGDPNNGDIDKYWFSRWDWVLREMIWGLETYIDDYPMSSGLEYNRELFDHIEKRKSNAMRLFGKYYGNLWS